MIGERHDDHALSENGGEQCSSEKIGVVLALANRDNDTGYGGLI
jgi:hypothetical protein